MTGAALTAETLTVVVDGSDVAITLNGDFTVAKIRQLGMHVQLWPTLQAGAVEAKCTTLTKLQVRV